MAADSYDGTQFNQRLTIDTSFMNNWASSPSPHSPGTPDYMMTPSPMMVASPVPSFASGFGGSFDDVLEEPFNDFSSHFSTFDSQSCGMNMYNGGCNDSLVIAGTDSLYNPFSDPYHHHDTNFSVTDLDLEFSAFMNCVPQYAM